MIKFKFYLFALLVFSTFNANAQNMGQVTKGYTFTLTEDLNNFHVDDVLGGTDEYDNVYITKNTSLLISVLLNGIQCRLYSFYNKHAPRVFPKGMVFTVLDNPSYEGNDRAVGIKDSLKIEFRTSADRKRDISLSLSCDGLDGIFSKTHIYNMPIQRVENLFDNIFKIENSNH